MLVGLGFCLAGAVAVLAVKVAWKLAVQTSQRRIDRGNSELAPAGELDEAALRTEYNKLRRRYELKVEDYNTQLAEQLTKLTRARNQTEELKASHSEACRQRGFDAGADAYFVKPFDPDEVISALRALLAGNDSNGDGRQ